jgi:hypothetical protein
VIVPTGAAGTLADALLLDRDGGREALDRLDVGAGELVEELARVAREALDITSLALGVERVEGEARLAGAGGAGDHDQLVARDREVDGLQVVGARAVDRDLFGIPARSEARDRLEVPGESWIGGARRRTAGGRAGSRPQPPNEPLRSMWVCLRSTSIHLTYSVSVFCWKRRLRSWGWASSKGHGLERAAIDELEQVATEGHLDGGRHLPGREALDRAVHPRCELRVVDPAEVALALGIHLRGASRDFLEFDAGLDLRPGGGDAGAGLGARGRRPAAVADDDVAEVDLFAAGRLLREALVVERLQLVLGHFDPGAHHRVHDLAAFDLALDLLAVLVDGEAVALDALVELVRRQSVVLGDRGDRRVDLLALGAELESFDDRGQQLALDQAVEGIAADLLHLALRGPSLAHALLDGARDLHHLGDEHDVVADLRRDPLDEGLGGSRRTGEQGKGGREDDEGADGEDNGEPGGEDGCAGRDRPGGEASATRPRSGSSSNPSPGSAPSR